MEKKKIKIKIELTPDKMQAFLELDQRRMRPGLLTKRCSRVQKASITFGLKRWWSGGLLREKVLSPVLIAEGKPPVKGRMLRLSFFETERMKLIPKEMEDGGLTAELLSSKCPQRPGSGGKKTSHSGDTRANVRVKRSSPPRERCFAGCRKEHLLGG